MSWHPIAMAAVITLSAYGWSVIIGYGFERGRNAATKHRKVCDVCFRDIERINAELARTRKPTAPPQSARKS